MGICVVRGLGERSPQREPEQPVSSCLWSSDIREKVREQVLHWYFFTSEWVCRWARRLDRSAKARLQCVQEKGFSPMGQRETLPINQCINTWGISKKEPFISQSL